MLLRWSLGRADAAAAVEGAVSATIAEGWRTPDLVTPETPAGRLVGTQAFTDRIVAHLDAPAGPSSPEPAAAGAVR
jgi:isocitrate dehydrogenase